MRNITVERLQKLRTLTDILIRLSTMDKKVRDEELISKISKLCKLETEDLEKSQ